MDEVHGATDRGLLKGEDVPIWSHPAGRMASIPLSQVPKFYFLPSLTVFTQPVPAGRKETPHTSGKNQDHPQEGVTMSNTSFLLRQRGGLPPHIPEAPFLPSLAAAFWLGALFFLIYFFY